MGSLLQLTVVGDEVDEAVAGSAWQAVSDEFDAVDEAMSRFRADSDVTHLNAKIGLGSFAVVEPRLYSGIAAAERARRLTAGRFDACVLAHLERLGHRGALVPGTPDRLPDASRDCWVERRPRRREVRLAEPVDLGGIGKGLALRWASRHVLRISEDLAPAGFLLDAGGDLVLAGHSPNGGPWSIGIEDPSGADAPIAVVSLTFGALCTSSVRIGRWQADDGRMVHHLIDPASGEPGGDGLRSVTVAGPDPAWSEVWSKSLFLSGRSAIAADARGRGLAAWWVDEDGVLSMTPAARVLTTWP